jgi:DNA-binding CsgD family transcriptional regulator
MAETLVKERAHWLEVFSELFRVSVPNESARRIAEELCVSLDADAVSLHWRNRRGAAGLCQWPQMIPRQAVRDYLDEPAILDVDPLWRWFELTQNPTPTTDARVPSTAADRKLYQAFQEMAKSWGVEQRLGIPVELGKSENVTFVAARQGADFAVHHVELATRLRPILRALHRQDAVARVEHHAPNANRCGLTRREQTVLTLLAGGLTAWAIGHRLQISERTVHKHLENIYKKLGVGDRLSAVTQAQTLGLVSAFGVLPGRGETIDPAQACLQAHMPPATFACAWEGTQPSVPCSVQSPEMAVVSGRWT